MKGLLISFLNSSVVNFLEANWSLLRLRSTLLFFSDYNLPFIWSRWLSHSQLKAFLLAFHSEPGAVFVLLPTLNILYVLTINSKSNLIVTLGPK